jgi:preprotein translocase subunit SecE
LNVDSILQAIPTLSLYNWQFRDKNAHKVSKVMNKIIQFLKDARAELMKVNWPTKQQTINYTLAVIGISIAVAVFLGGLDYFFEYILKTFLLK